MEVHHIFSGLDQSATGAGMFYMTSVGENKNEMQQLIDKKVSELKAIIPQHIYSENEENIQSVIGELLKNKKATLATAESCTGGFLAHKITKTPGCSIYYKGSVVAYAYEAKQNQLGVQKETLEKYGAVSEETVKEMVVGVLNTLNTDIGISISGIAGPGGGTPDKPVGTESFGYRHPCFSAIQPHLSPAGCEGTIFVAAGVKVSASPPFS